LVVKINGNHGAQQKISKEIVPFQHKFPI